MSEKEPSERKNRLVFFNFLCPGEKLKDVRELFKEKALGTLSEDIAPATRFLIGAKGVDEKIEGFSLSGITSPHKIKQIVEELAERKITGYSRLTQVLFNRRPLIREVQEQQHQEQPLYRLKVEFDEDGLVVAFDHALKASPEQLRDIEGPVTTFLIHPDKELYFGLRFVPRNVLSEVVRGLKSYLDDEHLTQEQLELITLGTKRLEDFMNPEKN